MLLVRTGGSRFRGKIQDEVTERWGGQSLVTPMIGGNEPPTSQSSVFLAIIPIGH